MSSDVNSHPLESYPCGPELSAANVLFEVHWNGYSCQKESLCSNIPCSSGHTNPEVSSVHTSQQTLASQTGAKRARTWNDESWPSYRLQKARARGRKLDLFCCLPFDHEASSSLEMEPGGTCIFVYGSQSSTVDNIYSPGASSPEFGRASPGSESWSST